MDWGRGGESAELKQRDSWAAVTIVQGWLKPGVAVSSRERFGIGLKVGSLVTTSSSTLQIKSVLTFPAFTVSPGNGSEFRSILHVTWLLVLFFFFLLLPFNLPLFLF